MLLKHKLKNYEFEGLDSAMSQVVASLEMILDFLNFIKIPWFLFLGVIFEVYVNCFSV